MCLITNTQIANYRQEQIFNNLNKNESHYVFMSLWKVKKEFNKQFSLPSLMLKLKENLQGGLKRQRRFEKYCLSFPCFKYRFHKVLSPRIWKMF